MGFSKQRTCSCWEPVIESWANVFLEAMACGLLVVTTNVGSDWEMVSDPGPGMIVLFGDGADLERALRDTLAKAWDRAAIWRHAEANLSKLLQWLTL